MSLATDSDVAAALGLANASLIPADQAARLPGEMARVERAFIREALRDFAAGAVRVQCSVLGGWITLLDSPADDELTVTNRDDVELDVLVADGARLKVGRYGCPLPSGAIVNVEYTAPATPAAVTAAVAAIVARRLSVAPGSPESKFTDLTAGADYRAKGAAWVSSTAVLTDDEKAEARSYRPVAGVAIISRWDDERRRWLEGWGWGWPYWRGSGW